MAPDVVPHLPPFSPINTQFKFPKLDAKDIDVSGDLFHLMGACAFLTVA